MLLFKSTFLPFLGFLILSSIIETFGIEIQIPSFLTCKDPGVYGDDWSGFRVLVEQKIKEYKLGNLEIQPLIAPKFQISDEEWNRNEWSAEHENFVYVHHAESDKASFIKETLHKNYEKHYTQPVTHIWYDKDIVEASARLVEEYQNVLFRISSEGQLEINEQLPYVRDLGHQCPDNIFNRYLVQHYFRNRGLPWERSFVAVNASNIERGLLGKYRVIEFKAIADYEKKAMKSDKLPRTHTLNQHAFKLLLRENSPNGSSELSDNRIFCHLGYVFASFVTALNAEILGIDYGLARFYMHFSLRLLGDYLPFAWFAESGWPISLYAILKNIEAYDGATSVYHPKEEVWRELHPNVLDIIKEVDYHRDKEFFFDKEESLVMRNKAGKLETTNRKERVVFGQENQLVIENHLLVYDTIDSHIKPRTEELIEQEEKRRIVEEEKFVKNVPEIFERIYTTAESTLQIRNDEMWRDPESKEVAESEIAPTGYEGGIQVDPAYDLIDETAFSEYKKRLEDPLWDRYFLDLKGESFVGGINGIQVSQYAYGGKDGWGQYRPRWYNTVYPMKDFKTEPLIHSIWQTCVHTATAGEMYNFISRFVRKMTFYGNSITPEFCKNYALCPPSGEIFGTEMDKIIAMVRGDFEKLQDKHERSKKAIGDGKLRKSSDGVIFRKSSGGHYSGSSSSAVATNGAPDDTAVEKIISPEKDSSFLSGLSADDRYDLAAKSFKEFMFNSDLPEAVNFRASSAILCTIPFYICRLYREFVSGNSDNQVYDKHLYMYIGLPLHQDVERQGRLSHLTEIFDLARRERVTFISNNWYLAELVAWKTDGWLKPSVMRIHGLHTNSIYFPQRQDSFEPNPVTGKIDDQIQQGYFDKHGYEHDALNTILIARVGTSGGLAECLMKYFLDKNFNNGINDDYPLTFTFLDNFLERFHQNGKHSNQQLYIDSRLPYEMFHQFRAALWFPYDTSLMLFWELYSSSVPIIAPHRESHILRFMWGQHTRFDLDGWNFFDDFIADKKINIPQENDQDIIIGGNHPQGFSSVEDSLFGFRPCTGYNEIVATKSDIAPRTQEEGFAIDANLPSSVVRTVIVGRDQEILLTNGELERVKVMKNIKTLQECGRLTRKMPEDEKNMYIGGEFESSRYKPQFDPATVVLAFEYDYRTKSCIISRSTTMPNSNEHSAHKTHSGILDLRLTKEVEQLLHRKGGPHWELFLNSTRDDDGLKKNCDKQQYNCEEWGYECEIYKECKQVQKEWEKGNNLFQEGNTESELSKKNKDKTSHSPRWCRVLYRTAGEQRERRFNILGNGMPDGILRIVNFEDRYKRHHVSIAGQVVFSQKLLQSHPFLASQRDNRPNPTFSPFVSIMKADAMMYWSSYADWSFYPFVIQFASLPDLFRTMLETDMHVISSRMKLFNERAIVMSSKRWAKIVGWEIE